MDLSKLDSSKIWSLIHIIIGGGICFFLIYLLSSILQTGFQALLNNLGCLGVWIFEETDNAFYIIMFGVVYLPGGFAGGLYAGYKIKEKLWISLAFPGVIGFLILFLIRYLSGSLSLSIIDFTKDIFIPLLGNVIGGYLGGYTMNWPSEEEEKLEAEKLTLDLK